MRIFLMPTLYFSKVTCGSAINGLIALAKLVEKYVVSTYDVVEKFPGKESWCEVHGNASPNKVSKGH